MPMLADTPPPDANDNSFRVMVARLMLMDNLNGEDLDKLELSLCELLNDYRKRQTDGGIYDIYIQVTDAWVSELSPAQRGVDPGGADARVSEESGGCVRGGDVERPSQATKPEGAT